MTAETTANVLAGTSSSTPLAIDNAAHRAAT